MEKISFPGSDAMKKYFCGVFILIAFLSGIVHAGERLRLATTTSTDNSGLLAVLHPPFERKYNVKVDVIAVGTGKALQLGENGDVDLVLVHAPSAEIKFVNDGSGIDRQPVMYNDFVILGPENDPAKAGTAGSISGVFRAIAESGNIFVSRGDDSGTHQKEMSLWKLAGIDPKGEWYLAAGQGMGAVLKIADDKLAYTLADRGTYLAYKDKMDLVIVFENVKALFNPYHVILVNPEKHPYVKYDLAKRYSDFIRGEEGQRIIREFKVGGEQLFHPDVLK